MPTLVLGRPRTRLAAGVTAAALAAGGLLAVASTPAQAATDLTLQWGVSQYLNEHLTTQGFTNGATEDANGVVTFTAGTGWRNGRASSTQYTGTARYAFTQGPTEIYSITVADPKVVTDADGAGQIVADVAWAVPSQSVTGSVTDTVVTTFTSSAGTWTGDVLSTTPRWAGVAPADTYGTGKPVDGKSWAVPFVSAMPASLAPFFYASGSNPTSDAKKFPAAFAAETSSAPAVQVAPTAASATNGLTLKVDGVNFTPVTQAGDAGVYVGLAPSGGLPDVTTQAGMDAFAASAWVMPSEFASGAWSKTMTAPTAKLDRTKTYSIYTWQAHSHSNTTQDTETPVAIDWASLFPAPAPPAPIVKTTPSVTLDWAKAPVVGTKGKLKVALAGGSSAPTGTLAVTLTKKGAKGSKSLSAAVTGSTVKLKLPKLAKGKWTVSVAYSGDAAYAAASSTSTVKVKLRGKKK